MLMEYKTIEVKFLGERKSWKEPCFGEFWKWNTFWLLGCPRCGKVATLQHTVEVKDDVATINPSVGCPFCHAHYFVKEGKVEVLSDF